MRATIEPSDDFSLAQRIANMDIGLRYLTENEQCFMSVAASPRLAIITFRSADDIDRVNPLGIIQMR